MSADLSIVRGQDITLQFDIYDGLYDKTVMFRVRKDNNTTTKWREVDKYNYEEGVAKIKLSSAFTVDLHGQCEYQVKIEDKDGSWYANSGALYIKDDIWDDLELIYKDELYRIVRNHEDLTFYQFSNNKWQEISTTELPDNIYSSVLKEVI